MFINGNWNWKKLALFVAPLVLLFVFSLGAFGVQDEECCLYQEQPECPDRYSSFNPSEDTYSPGETVELTLSGLTEMYLIEEIKIEKLVGRDEGIVYTEVIDQQVSVDETEWTWTWNQVGNHGEQVANGRYFALVETDCCGIFRTNFKIHRQVRRPVCSCSCCGRSSTMLDTGCSRYESGEEVMINFSNCGNCDINFKSLEIKRSDRCCGSEIVFSHHFEGGFDPGRNWSWGWDQRNPNENLVEPGRYTVIVETECCGTLKANFTVYEKRDCCRTSYERRDCCQSSCCNSGFLSFGFCGSSCSRSSYSCSRSSYSCSSGACD